MLRIAIYQPYEQPLSISGYAASIRRELESLDIRFCPFDDIGPLPADVDVYWDPGAAGGSPPSRKLLAATKPLVATVHGAAPMALPAREYFSDRLKGLQGRWSNFKKKLGWRRFEGRYAAIIAVSEFARREIVTHLDLLRDSITVIAHGVAHDRFWPAKTRVANGDRFFLHLSQYQPLKNIKRTLEAYERIAATSNIRFQLIAPGLPEISLPQGVTAVREPVPQERAADLYRAATGFVFPSLRESFGMPILEAMASGCPVITSRGSACEETAGDAALLVDPYSVDELSSAMARLASDAELRKDLRRRGVKRAAEFSWQKSAQEHLAVFASVLQHGTGR